MAEAKTVLNAIHAALNRRDAEAATSFFADDATMVCPEGVFKGKNEIKRYFTWLLQQWPQLKLSDAGTGVIVEGNQATHEYVSEGTSTRGSKGKVACVATCELSDGKVMRLNVYYDRLSIADQAATGFMERRFVTQIVQQMERGL